MGRRLSGNGGGSAPRAQTLNFTVPTTQTGTAATLSGFNLLAPVAFARTGGNANLTFDGSGNVGNTAAIAGGATQTQTGTATGADGAQLPLTINVTGQVTVPAAPTLGALTPANNQISIPWTDNGTGGSAITSHDIQRGTVAGAETFLANTTSGSPFVDTTAVNGTAYFYKVVARNVIGPSVPSNEASATPTASSALLIASLSRPALALSQFYNTAGTSITAGIASPAGQDYPANLRTIITTNIVAGFHFGATGGNAGTAIAKVGNGGMSAQNSTTITASITGNLTANSGAYASENARTTIFMAAVNDYNSAVTPYQGRDWPAVVKANTATAAGAISGGDGLWSFLEPAESICSAGMQYGADHRFHFFDMVSARGRRVVDVARWLRMVRKLAGITAGTVDDWAVNVMGVPPYSYRGGASDFGDGNSSGQGGVDAPVYNFTNSTAPNLPSDLTPADGTIGTNSYNNTTYRKIGASGAGSWETCETKHFSRYGYNKIARLVGDVFAAIEGIGGPFVPPARMRCPADSAASTIIGQLLPTGTVAQYALRNYDDTAVTTFSVDANGHVSRTGTGTLAEGLNEIVVVAKNANGVLVSPLDIFVTRPSTVTAPQMRTIASPGFSICGRDAHGMANGAQISGASWFKTPASGTTAYLDYLIRKTAPLAPVAIQVNGSGFVKFVLYDTTNTLVLNSNPSTTLSPNTVYWLTWALDFSANKACVYFNEVAPTFTPTLPSTTLPLSDSTPFFLCSGAAHEFANAASALQTQCGFKMFTDGYIDWTVAANRRALYDTSGNPVTRTPYAAIGGVQPRFEMWGGVGDWMWGSPDGSTGANLLSVSHRASILLS